MVFQCFIISHHYYRYITDYAMRIMNAILYWRQLFLEVIFFAKFWYN